MFRRFEFYEGLRLLLTLFRLLFFTNFAQEKALSRITDSPIVRMVSATKLNSASLPKYQHLTGYLF